MSVFRKFYQKGKRVLFDNAILVGGFTYILVIHVVWMNIQSYNTKITGEPYKRIPIIDVIFNIH